ncbi:MAG: serine/threonine-protein kinase [Silvibacterium sp.]
MMQDSENWQELQALFHLAETTPEKDRDRILAERCPDPELRRRALEIFHAATVADSEGSPRSNSFSGGKIGPYTVLRHLGSGGIGSVYLVERMVGGALQRSALKILAPHAAGPGFIERFQREQHILATLDHPNITRLLDAGLSDSAQPYLAMEYVDGEHLDAYCDVRNLKIAERLHIFLSVCDAVAHAHRNLVVHLDLKPSNILVSTDGVVKLLDFGTSKLIQPDSLLTTTLLATPAYASPEQLRNDPVTTACDIYALGAILFELLAGHRPGDKASVAVMIERALREQEAEPLSNAITAEAAAHRGLSEKGLRADLDGDLATIVGKCLSPQPKDRYSSMDALMSDVQRFLDGRPILARPQTALYRMSKFLRRNRRLVALATASVLLIVTALGYAEIKQKKAIQEGRRAEQMQNFMHTLLRLANSGYMGKSDPSVSDLLHTGAEVLPQYIQDPVDLRLAQLSLAGSIEENDNLDDAEKLYQKVDASAIAGGDISAQAASEEHLGQIAYIKGDAEKGAAMTDHALQLSRDSQVPPLTRAESEMYYAFYRDNLGLETNENLRLLHAAVDLERKTNQPANELGLSVRLLADDLLDRGRPDDAEPYLIQARQIYGDDPALLCGRAQVEGDLGFVAGKRGDLKKSVEFREQAYQDMRKCAGDNSHGTGYEATYLADALLMDGRNQEALDLMEKITPSLRKTTGHSTDFSDSLRILSKAYLKTGHLPEAEAAVKEAIAIRTGQTAPTHPVFGSLHLIYAEILIAEHRDREALPHAELANQIMSQAVVNAPGLHEYAVEAAQVLAGLRARLAVAGKQNS